MARIFDKGYYLYNDNKYIRCPSCDSVVISKREKDVHLFFLHSNFPLKLDWFKIYIKEPQDLLRELYGKNI